MSAFQSTPSALTAEELEAKVREAILASQTRPLYYGEQELIIRATALQGGKWPVVSETIVVGEIRKQDK